MIKRLAEDHIYQVNAATSADVLKLIQLLRATSYEDLELLWKQLSGNDEHRYSLTFLEDHLIQCQVDQ